MLFPPKILHKIKSIYCLNLINVIYMNIFRPNKELLIYN